MTQQYQHRLWLALLTVILLSMQSLAIWHDAEHAFHDENEQCERYEVFAHTPVLDAVPSSLLLTFTSYSVSVFPTPITLVIAKQRDTDAIRAPPLTSPS